ncbi:MAG TPA: 2-oxo-4-hydroxy-4-carboxy-5-ureidoimidazoline decarboxylase, partial [Pyrinomonadaceae bacterium]|nr:2-oxo-4-hydroxy-4-carboxy-5-ureidoimidazoline decarboxylase [Pyrinomonadaceae bacterium]
ALLEKAEQVWLGLEHKDWLEAFAAHPKIGERKAAPKQPAKSAEWSQDEQSGTQSAARSALEELAEANRLYEERFGFIFIVCATGKSAEEMLEICRERLNNETEAEIHIAAGEQRKITEIRLKKLLESEN